MRMKEWCYERLFLLLLVAKDKTTMAPDQCALPLQPDIAEDEEVEEGVRFGSRPHSRMEFSKLPARMRIR